MSSSFVIFQFVPDPGTGERVNFGVATYGDDGYYARFVRSWRRIQTFHDDRIDFLKDFAKRVDLSTRDQLSLEDESRITPALLIRAAEEWTNSIQVTAPRASTVNASELIDDVARQFLREPPRHRRAPSKQLAANIASDYVHNALFQLDVSEGLLKRRQPIEGALEEHNYDIVISNGHPVAGALALSFQTKSRRELSRDVQVTAWSLDDVKKRHPELDLAVVMFPPRGGTGVMYDHAVDVFEGLEARVVPLTLGAGPDADAQDWAERVAELAKDLT